MRLDVLVPLFLSLPVGMVVYILLTKNIRAHLRSWADRIAFFFWPFGPARMLVVQELDGDVNIYYDDEYEEVQSKDKVLVKTIDGQQYVTEVPPSQSSVAISMFDAKAPSGYFSPFGVAWRWIVAASISWYLFYYALIVSWIPPIELAEVKIGLETLRVAIQMPLDPWEAMLSTTIFFVGLTWLFVNVQRMNDRTIMYAWYHAKGINPPHISIVPSPTMSSIGLLDYLEKLGRDIKIVVPKDSAEIIKEALDQVKDKTGSKSLAAVILAKLALAKTWKQTIAKILREQLDIFKAGETSAAVRLSIQPLSKKILPYIVLSLVVGLVIGYALGNAYGFGVAPAPEQNQTQPANLYPGYPGNQTMPSIGESNQTTVQPSQPPPPPQAEVITVVG